MRGHHEVSVGALLGSNIFNCLFIAGIAGLIAPFSEELGKVLPSILFGMMVVLTLKPFRERELGISRAFVLLGLDVASVLFSVFLGVVDH